MALDPADRYSTPKALAEDVERWMADEPVAAFRESWARTLTRWLARHRTGVTALGAAMLVALGGLAAVLAVQARANRQLTVKNTELDSALRREAQVRREAETNFNTALQAVEDYLTSVSENTLLKQQDSVEHSQPASRAAQHGAEILQEFRTSAEQRPQPPRATGKRLFPRRRDHPGDRFSCRGDRGVFLSPNDLGSARSSRLRKS